MSESGCRFHEQHIKTMSPKLSKGPGMEQSASRVYLTVAGNIGVGKSTAVGILSDAFDWQPYFEWVDEQPYLTDYYTDPGRWGFHSQIWFLSQRFEQQQEIADTPISVIQDRSIYEDYEVFVKGLLEQRILSHRDFRTYRRLYQMLVRVATPPTLLLYLRASVPTLQARIAHRARPSEQNISDAYLEQLNHRYEEWLRRFDLCPVLTIETDQLNLLENTLDQVQFLEQVRHALGLGTPANLQPGLPGIDRTALLG